MSFRTIWERYTFPFKGALWAFWLLAAAPVVWGTAFPCASYPEYFYLTYPVMTVVACLWEAHARQLITGRSMGLQVLLPIVSRAIANLLVLAASSFLMAIPFSFFLPAYQCYGDRAKTSELVLGSLRLRNTIESKIKAARTVEKSGVGISVQPEGRISNGFVTDDGIIILISDNPAAVLTMTPSLRSAVGDEVQWHCRGYPERIFPLTCRAEGQK